MQTVSSIAKYILTPAFALLVTTVQSQQPAVFNKSPLQPTPYAALPLGAIKAKGWLQKMLELQRDGLTGNLDSVYPEVCGPTNAWLGGEGDAWERGPYWLDGLLPLAYLLDDKALQQKTQRWVEWTLANQREDGYIGPRPPGKALPRIPGVQNSYHEDWWPRMVMLKVLQQYHSATGDKRVINCMSRYFRYMLANLPQKPLGHWTFWAAQRGGDNLAVVYWLYNITGEKFLLELGDLMYKQTTPWKTYFTDGTFARLNPSPDLHCVNVAQGIKTPAIQFQRTGDSAYLFAVKQGLQTLRAVYGFANGMYGADEMMRSNDPTQGSELCSAVEMMFSVESMLPITGDVAYADHLEKIAFNVLPSQHNDDFTHRQYFQQANQIKVSYNRRNFVDNEPSRQVFGVLTGYPCCTANMHQGYPKYVQNLWYASADGGLAALVYGASEVAHRLTNGRTAKFTEETAYPFEEQVRFVYNGDAASFPLHLRIPAWCDSATIKINGKYERQSAGNAVVVVSRNWTKGDVLTLDLPMDITTSRWAENSVAVERGPILYALKLDEKWEQKTAPNEKQPYYEVHTDSPWNYGLAQQTVRKNAFTVQKVLSVSAMPWNIASAPVTITTQGKRINTWTEYNHSAGKLPRSNVKAEVGEAETITLIPYGCTALRISQFPVMN